ncbi:lipid-transfer protein [Nocardioides sp. W7]|uniref:lipid-transfer protein n=1 Tax=Nocardioides sp. W7 TaxID=2931390 RepID=UPI001FD47C80|nr:lipid-transfer protein [Nocardioides sp. W7]
MREVAVVAFAQSVQDHANRESDMAEILLPVVSGVLDSVGLTRDQVDFFASGSHDFFEGRTFAYIDSLDAVGAWPPISESHVEMDAAWALAEAWSWLQLGEGDIALVYGVGCGTRVHDLDDVMPTQLDPYYLAPLRPHQDALAGIQARACLEAGITDERRMAEVVSRSLAAASDSRTAWRSGDYPSDDLMELPYVASPLRSFDVAPVVDAAAAVVLATGDVARRLCGRPAWIRGLDHRIETHYPGARDLTRSPSTETALATVVRQAAEAGTTLRPDAAELHLEYSHQEAILANALGLSESVAVNPSGGPLAGRPVTATGLARVGEAAALIHRGGADQVLAHATHGPVLQQNLVCLLEGER